MTQKAKGSAIYNEFVIERAENDSITVKYRNTKDALRNISKEVGFEYQDDWNTRTFGNALINFLNSPERAQAGSNLDVENEEDEVQYISDEDWQWWFDLSDSMKYVILWNLKAAFLDKHQGLIPEFDTFDDSLSTEVDLYDKNEAIEFYLGDYIVGRHSSDGSFIPGLCSSLEIPNEIFDIYDLPKLSHLKQLTSLSFNGWGGGFDNFNMGLFESFQQLESLDLSRNDVDLKSLGVLSSLANLRTLVLERCDIDEDSDEFLALKAKLPNVTIIV